MKQVSVNQLSEILNQCNEDMPVFLEVEKGVFKEFKGLLMEDTDKEYRVVLSVFPNTAQGDVQSTSKRGEKVTKYKVIANDDAMKYQVVDAVKGDRVLYENDGKYEADKVCDELNTAYAEGKSGK